MGQSSARSTTAATRSAATAPRSSSSTSCVDVDTRRGARRCGVAPTRSDLTRVCQTEAGRGTHPAPWRARSYEPLLIPRRCGPGTRAALQPCGKREPQGSRPTLLVDRDGRVGLTEMTRSDQSGGDRTAISFVSQLVAAGGCLPSRADRRTRGPARAFRRSTATWGSTRWSVEVRLGVDDPAASQDSSEKAATCP
jgi:hypothetical protein